MASHHEPRLDVLAEDQCRDWPQGCSGEVKWQTDGTKRCDRHQRLHERLRRKQRLLALPVTALIVVIGATVVNALIRPEEGPSQAKAWEVCHDRATAVLDLPEGARFAGSPLDPSERVKLLLASDLYRVYSYYEVPGSIRTEFVCTVRYLGNDRWEVADLTMAP